MTRPPRLPRGAHTDKVLHLSRVEQIKNELIRDGMSREEAAVEAMQRVYGRRALAPAPPEPDEPTNETETEAAPMSDQLPAILGDVVHDVAVARPPELVLDEAQKAATALKRVLDQKPNKVMFNNEQYLEAEDWILLGRFYGVTAKIEWTRPVEFADVAGFEARAVAVRADGEIVSAAEAMCLNDEEKWRSRPKYAWCYVTKGGARVVDDPGPDQIVWEDNPAKPGKKRPKKERTLIGEEKVPLFQLRSMAQTRATAKVLSNVLRWVPVLAGYRGTPAEELPTTEAPQQGAPPTAAPRITKAQLKRLQEHSQAAGHSRDAILDWLGIRALTDIPAAEYDAILARIDNVTPLSGSIAGEIVDENADKNLAARPHQEPADSAEIEF